MPEAIEIKRVLKFDEQTSCMKPDLQVTVNADAIQCDNGKLEPESEKIYLRMFGGGASLVLAYDPHFVDEMLIKCKLLC